MPATPDQFTLVVLKDLWKTADFKTAESLATAVLTHAANTTKPTALVGLVTALSILIHEEPEARWGALLHDIHAQVQLLVLQQKADAESTPTTETL